MKKFLGSAAAMAMVTTGVHAADVVVAEEPDPVEYVRVCDAFGNGFFYIPGTETCLGLSGEVRMRVFTSKDEDSYNTSYRARLNVDTRSDTELGELRAFIRFQGRGARKDEISVNDAANVAVDKAYLQLGGLFAGYSESAWVTTTNSGGSGFGGNGVYDGDYGYQQRNMLQYQFNSSDYFAAISLEDDNDSTSWMPDIVGRLGGVFGGLTVYGVGGYDQSVEEFGVKVGLKTDIGPDGDLIFQGFYASGTTDYDATAPGGGTAQWSILGSYAHDITETVTAYVNGQYFADLYGANDASTGVNAWAVSGGFDWAPVPQFRIRTNAGYSDRDGPDGDDWNFVTEVRRTF